MQWAKDLALGESVRGEEKRIIKKLTKKEFRDYYLICYSLNPDEMLDLFPVRVVTNPHFPEKDLMVLGIEGGREEAILVTTDLLTDSFQQTGDWDIRKRRDAVCFRKGSDWGGSRSWQ